MTVMTGLGDRVVVVTGGSRNLGLAMSERFGREGSTVVINGVVPGEAAREAQRLRDGGMKAYGIDADVSDGDAVAQMFAQVRDDFGRVDVLVNNAAVPMVGRVSFEALTIDDWDRSFAVNVRGAFLCTKHAVALMTQGGSIVNISSIGATKAHRQAVAYDSTKGAIEAFTRAVSLELAPRRIRVNAVAPGAIINDRQLTLAEDRLSVESAPIPWGRSGYAGEVASAVAFLASDDAQYVTGTVLAVDGGLSAQARQPDAEVDVHFRGDR